MPTLILLLQGHTHSVAAGPHSAHLCIHWGSCTNSPNAASHKADPLPSNGHVSRTLPKHWETDCTLYCNLSVSICLTLWSVLQKYDSQLLDLIESRVESAPAMLLQICLMTMARASCLVLILSSLAYIYIHHAMTLLTCTYAMQWCWLPVLTPCSDVACACRATQPWTERSM